MKAVLMNTILIYRREYCSMSVGLFTSIIILILIFVFISIILEWANIRRKPTFIKEV